MLESTPARLILTAERLYALHGIDRVSMRQIADAAGQRNPAAVQYHFGNTLDLMRTIVRYRNEPYNARQLQLCAELDAQGRPFELRGLVEASLAPFAVLEPPDSHFVGFLAELLSNPDRFIEVFSGVDAELLTGPRLLEERLDEALDYLPPQLRSLRLNLAMNAGLSAISRSHVRNVYGAPSAVPLDILLADLIRTITAFLEPEAPEGASARMHP